MFENEMVDGLCNYLSHNLPSHDPSHKQIGLWREIRWDGEISYDRWEMRDERDWLWDGGWDWLWDEGKKINSSHLSSHPTITEEEQKTQRTTLVGSKHSQSILGWLWNEMVEDIFFIHLNSSLFHFSHFTMFISLTFTISFDHQ